MTRTHLFCLVIAAACLVASGCTTRPKRAFAVAPPARAVPAPELSVHVPLYRLPPSANLTLPEQPKFDPVQDVIEKAEAAFRRGENSYTAGHLEMAKQEFNAAIATLLQSPVTPQEDKRLQRTFDSLVERIHNYEVEALRQGDGFREPNYQPAPVDELQTLTFPEDPQVSQLVGESPAGTRSEIPLVTNSQVESIVKHFTSGRGRATLEAAWKRSGRYRDMIFRVLEEEGVPRELIHLAQAESGFQPRARSYAAAVGMWQFLAWRGKEYGLDRSWWEDERMNPEEATRAAARHLKDLYNQFGDWYLAMAAYHCGPVCVQKAVERTGYADFWELSRRRVLPATTRNYVPVVLAFIIIGKNQEMYGIHDLEEEPAWAFDTVTVTHPTDLRLVAEMVGTGVETIRELNPSLLRMTTPKSPEYALRIPLATRDLFLKRVAMIPPEKRVFWRWHSVGYGETLTSIARQFKTSVQAIAEVNNLDPSQPLMEAAELVIPVGTTRSEAAPGILAGPGERHVVERNETLSAIARRYNITTAQLMDWNNLDDTLIRVGQSLLVNPENVAAAVPPAPPLPSQGNGGPATPAARRIATTSSSSSPRAARPSQVSTGRLVHRVQKGESLWQIATNYHTSVEALRKNNRHLGKTLQIGDPVYIPPSN